MNSTNQVITSFKSLRVDSWLLKNLEQLGINQPTTIQQQTIPLTLSGQNVIGNAQTGSGKTLCFALPILQKLSQDPYGVFALIITPTRELAYQIGQQFEVLSRGSSNNMNLRISIVVGGVDMMKQAKELADIPHIIIATPGRLASCVENDQSGLVESLENL